MAVAFIVKFLDRNLQKDRSVLFCSRECAAIGVGSQDPTSVRVPAALAQAIECHCCGFALDEVEPVKRGA